MPESARDGRGEKEERISNRRRKQAEVSRRKILETAVRLFDERGYEKVTVADICREAGLSVGAFYHHFRSKDQILLERYLPFARQVDSFYQAINHKARAESRGALERLARYLDLFFKYIEEAGPEALKTAFATQIEPGFKYSLATADMFRPHQELERIIADGQGSGEIRTDMSPEELARVLYRSMVGTLFAWCLVGGSFSLREAGRRCFKLAVEGMAKK
ncbi:TetR/AcrR family transcriptional regulator [Candidatus Solincola tengchongensis]|uniref:TetR/AcrR family transcriptional regulator n=1 Tax=Candidatus Solincola tengchongensis TaxID=2900693 RepID=UPI00257E44AB|nr:TetR/AcrR family transcriptional regulator [Candidatus Solincola tengchongensis]